MSKIEKTEEMFCYQCEQRAGCSDVQEQEESVERAVKRHSFRTN